MIQPPNPPATAIVYVSRKCGACGKFLQMMAGNKKLLMAVEPRILEGNPRAILEMHELGAIKTPTMVVFHPNGQRTVHQGVDASTALIRMA